ncbi:hypothetical protein [Psychrobacillus sp. NPDC093180]|uniref:hypothetical protein n=1 Tax=Psychrobacillus sp. NPDC093180 TaxID=3364489 RepID=UPI0038147CB6
MNKTDFEWITRNRKKVFTFTFGWMVLFGGLFFPIGLTQYIPLSIAMLVVYFYIGYILFGLFEKRPIVMILFAFIFNSIGLINRILLEWGEYNMIRDLTIFNVTIYLMSIPLYITVVYLVLKRLNGRNKNKMFSKTNI